jgi:hypothetical protein
LDGVRDDRLDSRAWELEEEVANVEDTAEPGVEMGREMEICSKGKDGGVAVGISKPPRYPVHKNYRTPTS